jgi:hypothetical protein
MQRLYGVAFATKEELNDHLLMLEEAKKRDHRKLGKEMDLFHVDEENPGQVFWHPKGWSIYVGLMDYMRAKQRANGYVEVHTPSVMAKSLWERSGHWDKYRDNMFTTESEKRDFAIKPMNCPGHILIFNQGLRSYRDLPLRMAEFGSCCRNEVSGALLAIALVLIGVFLPTSFIPGISGQFYRQFAVTIMSATAISAFVSLTLSPALAALLLRPKAHAEAPVAAGPRGWPTRSARAFNNGFARLSERYGRFSARAVRMLAIIGIAYVALIGLTVWRFADTPTGFIPAQDQGYVIAVLQLPPGTSLERTTAALEQAQAIALKNPATAGTVAFGGFDGATFTNAPNTAAMFVSLKPHGERASAGQVLGELHARLAHIPERDMRSGASSDLS